MNQLLPNRIRLIRSLQAALSNGFHAREKAVITSMLEVIRRDDRRHRLALADNRPGFVIYS